MTTRTNRADIDIMVSAFVDGLTTRQQAYQNAVLNGKDATSARQDLEQTHQYGRLLFRNGPRAVFKRRPLRTVTSC